MIPPVSRTFLLQLGQVGFLISQASMHSRWKLCEQAGIFLTSYLGLKLSQQIEHTSSVMVASALEDVI